MLLTTLDHCPACSADLADRPPPNRCPGCGLEYDQDTRVWRSGESWASLSVGYATVGLVIGIGVAAIYRLSMDRVPNPTVALLYAVIAPALGLIARRVLGGRITGRFVALTPRGILVGTRTTPFLVPWSDFDRLAERRGEPKIRRRSTTTPVAVDDIFVDAEECAAFRNAVKSAAERYRATDSWMVLPRDL